VEDFETISTSADIGVVRVLHISDSHVSVEGDDTEEVVQFCARMHGAYSSYDRLGSFMSLMDLAIEKDVDLIALGGDQVNYPGPRAVERLTQELKRTRIPWVFTAGNHDWHYEGMPGSSTDLRQRWRQELAPFYAGNDPHASSVEVNGLRFVLIDNSTFQIDDHQLTFFRDSVSDGTPVVLMVHIPLSVPTLRNDRPGKPLCGDPEWGEHTDNGWETERREKWSAAGNLPSTERFLAAAELTPNLVAVLCGHIHQARVDRVSDSASQYVVAPGFDRGCRLIEFTSGYDVEDNGRRRREA
jgi:3',5'-cyclic AMP phosphodiesterase CpdA